MCSIYCNAANLIVRQDAIAKSMDYSQYGLLQFSTTMSTFTDLYIPVSVMEMEHLTVHGSGQKGSVITSN